MKNFKRIITLFLLLVSFVSYGKNVENKDKSIDNKKSETRTIVDQDGHEVQIPNVVKTVASVGVLPLPSVYVLYVGTADNLVAMNPHAKSTAKHSFLKDKFPNILNVSTDHMKGGQLNIEELLKINPDIVITANSGETLEKVTNAGLPGIVFSPASADFNTIKTLIGWLKLLKEIFPDGDGQKMIEIAEKAEEKVLERTSKLTDSERPTVMFIFNYANNVIKISGNKFFGEYWAYAGGGKNVASELSRLAEVTMEQIYEWDPDIIFVTNFTPVQPDDIYNNKIEGHDWSILTAVKEKKVYKVPIGMFRWYPPSYETPLALQWYAKMIQPELFKDLDMDKTIKEYYKEVYEMELTDEDIEKIYNPSSEASK